MKKRIVCALICLAAILPAAGCKNKKDKAKVYEIDFARFANVGTMPESELRLGDDLPEFDPQDEQSKYFSMDDANPPFIGTAEGNFSYYYEKGENPKITAIMAYDTCFGFENDTVSIVITDALDSQNVKYTERKPREDETLFMPREPNVSLIECKSFKHRLIFIIKDNALCAAYIGD